MDEIAWEREWLAAILRATSDGKVIQIVMDRLRQLESIVETCNE